VERCSADKGLWGLAILGRQDGGRFKMCGCVFDDKPRT